MPNMHITYSVLHIMLKQQRWMTRGTRMVAVGLSGWMHVGQAAGIRSCLCIGRRAIRLSHSASLSHPRNIGNDAAVCLDAACCCSRLDG
jgi:hypothetical protein